MKRELCPKCGEGRLRKRTSKPYGSCEKWYRNCSRGCGYSEVMLVQPAQIISVERLDGTTAESSQPILQR